MTRRDQITQVARAAGITARQARDALDAYAAVTRFELVEDGRSTFHGVGTFTLFVRRPRRVTNPRTGHLMDLPATTTVKFRPFPELRESVKR